jgi:arginase
MKDEPLTKPGPEQQQEVAGQPATSSPFLVGLLGIPSDHNSSFERGAAAGPKAIRAALWSDRGNLASELGPEIGQDILIDDAGDIAISGNNDADAAALLAAITAMQKAGHLPVALGGDHAVSLPLVMAAAATHGPVSILHIDAHSDLYDDFGGNPRSHASPFARIMEHGLASGLVQVGIRTLNAHCRAQAERFWGGNRPDG